MNERKCLFYVTVRKILLKPLNNYFLLKMLSHISKRNMSQKQSPNAPPPINNRFNAVVHRYVQIKHLILRDSPFPPI